MLLVVVFLESLGSPDRPIGFAITLLLILLTFPAFGYVAVNHDEIVAMAGRALWFEAILGAIALLLVLEAARRAAGLALPILAVVFLSYTYFGQYLPFNLGGHGGFSIERVTTFMYLTENGIFGVAVYVVFKFVYLFVVFGKLLEKTGALDFIMDFARATVGHFRGGPAMVATVSSGLVGTMSGSAAANVMVTGAISIPLMKRLGFKAHVAGAVEAAASTGGQLMPPVMGATAFLMMQFLGVEYLDVIKAAFLPAVLYFLAVLAAVYLYALRSGLKGSPASELPMVGHVLRRREGLAFVGGFGALLGLLVARYSPILAALYAMAVVCGLSMFSTQRITVKKAVLLLGESAQNFASLGAASACVGIIIAVVLLTGLGSRLADIMLLLSGERLIPLLLLTMLASIILGTGIPTSVAYIILAITIAPALIEAGVLPMAAHLFIFYSGLLAMVTPPVAMAAFVGATLAQADFWKTSVMASVFALPAYLLPFAFVLDPSLLLLGSPPVIVLHTSTALIGAISAAAALVGPLGSRVELLSRVLFLAGGIFLVVPSLWFAIYGLILDGLALIIPVYGWMALKPREAGESKGPQESSP